MNSIGNFKAFHPVCMTPLLEVYLKSSTTPITEVSTNLAFIFNTQSMEFIKPVWNRLTVPTQRQIFRIVDWSISFFTLR
jgi:hypothetical protein